MTAMTKFYSPTPLDDERLYQLAPSIFAHGAHRSRSERFKPIPTIQAVRALRNEGWQCYGASQSRTRTVDRVRFTKHMLKFRHSDVARLTRVGDAVLETILTNANDGSKGYHLDCGIFKLACLNGMVVKSHDFGSLMVRHIGDDVISRVLEGTHVIASNAAKVMDTPDRWSRILLDREQRQRFATAAHGLRFGNDQRVEPQQLLVPRREADTKHDLWSVFNVVQENCLQGGLSAMHNRGRAWTTRRIGSIDDNMRLNSQLWQLGEATAKEAA
jgi:hypothetical protein